MPLVSRISPNHCNDVDDDEDEDDDDDKEELFNYSPMLPQGPVLEYYWFVP